VNCDVAHMDRKRCGDNRVIGSQSVDETRTMEKRTISDRYRLTVIRGKRFDDFAF
jgi:hypothetical protein